jgi:hypothetical protein
MELRDCLAYVLGVDVPVPEGDEAGFWRAWLGGRNLGLVPVSDPAAFAWPGHWIAADREGRHAVMFGSPSGPVTEAIGPIERGWVVARLDLALEGYGDAPGSGTVDALLVAPAAEAAAVRVERAVAVAGRGLEGDRYFAGAGTFQPGNALTAVEAEALEALPLGFEEARRNVVTRGIDLNALVGRRFRIGEVECRAVRLAEPCAHLQRLTRPGVLRGLVHRAGIRVDLLTDGTIAVGDSVEPL